MNLKEAYNYLIDNEIVNKEALDMITDINGFTEKTLNDVICYKTGYCDIQQLKEYYG